jgi:hypothetical protein
MTCYCDFIHATDEKKHQKRYFALFAFCLLTIIAEAPTPETKSFLLTTMLKLIIFLHLAVVSAFSPIPVNSHVETISDQIEISRRNWLSSSVAAVASSLLLVNPSRANAADNLVEYKNTECKFSIKVPSGWENSIQELPDRRKIVLYIDPTSNQKTLLFVAYTPVRDDFTSLGSFGSVDQVSDACGQSEKSDRVANINCV